ncbi:transcriptional regulator [Actinomadura darangshiensis]|uniref:Transcriptional regulator n=1 Tax=Actinomadura darangshiensis TaxID=705336 RepID=A0A4V2YV46_9ACTN|nr:helix-turn-helix transcriptional regulator [Actinomadura darangshiensis]TDD80087.1 transcriptional regulator [Actinomadura darangshiensis]
MASHTITGSRQSPPAHPRPVRAEGDPLVPRMLLGRRLHDLREAAGLSRRDAARTIDGSESKITRLELGQAAAKPGDVSRLLARYGADAAERTTLLALAEQTNARAWWHGDGDIVARWVRQYLSAEQAAKLVRTFEAQFVPGLLQTEDYARALIRRDHPEAEVERRVGFRLRRQRVLRRRPRPLNLWIVLDEAALWRPTGSPETMRGQIRHIVELCRRPNVTVQIAPFGISGRIAGDGPLTLVRFPQQSLQDMVYLERPDKAVYPVRRVEIERHWHVFNTLVTEAAPPEQTPQILAGILATY